MRITGTLFCALGLCATAGLLPLPLPAADIGEWIDLTHELSAEAVFWPTAAPFSMTTDFEGVTDQAVGIDTASIDHGKSTHFEAHVALMSRNVPAFENVANLDRLPATGVFVVALPVKIRGGSGGPLRIVARVNAPE